MATSVTSEGAPLESYDWPAGTNDCPYPFYTAVRNEGVYRYEGETSYGANPFLVSRWEDIIAVTQHPEIFEQVIGYEDELPYTRRLRPPFQNAPRGRYAPFPLFYQDGVDHKEIRGYAKRVSGAKHLERYSEQTRRTAHELIDAFIDRGECEFRNEFAERLPAYTISDLTELPREDLPKWNLLFRLSQGGPLTESEQARQAYSPVFGFAYEYMEKLVLERYKNPGSDVISGVIRDHVERDGGLDLNWQVVFWSNMCTTGSRTSIAMFTNLIVHLARNPEVVERARRDRSLVPAVLLESLRLELPAHTLPRIARVDTEVGGVPIPAGSIVCVLFAAGNRDEEQWEDADDFRCERPAMQKDSLTFGRGVHRCVGSPLARWEGAIGLDCILDRLRNIRVDEERSDFRQPEGDSKPKSVWITFDRA